MHTAETIAELLCKRIHKADVDSIAKWAAQSNQNLSGLYKLMSSENDRISNNALWCISSLPKSEARSLQQFQHDLIDRLLTERHPSKKRILLQILREQEYDKGSIRADLIDYCLMRITCDSEPVAVRSFCIYCAFKMCRHFPELLGELEEHLPMLSTMNLTPGLRCARNATLKAIRRLR